MHRYDNVIVELKEITAEAGELILNNTSVSVRDHGDATGRTRVQTDMRRVKPLLGGMRLLACHRWLVYHVFDRQYVRDALFRTANRTGFL